jgi:peptide deformylase
MPVKKICRYPSDELKSITTTFNLEKDVNVFKDLYDTIKHFEGIDFITSNQIGYNVSSAIIDKNVAFKEDNKDIEERYLFVINPVIESLSKKNIVKELENSISSSGFSALVERSNTIQAKFKQLKFKKLNQEKQENPDEIKILAEKFNFNEFEEVEFNGILHENYAKTLQRVTDQLNGICFLDKISYFNKNRYFKFINNIKKLTRDLIQNKQVKSRK